MVHGKIVLITGATGFIGSCLAHRLVKRNYNIHIIKREYSNIWRIKDIIYRITTHNVDLVDTINLEKVVKDIKPNIILHMATYGGYPFQKNIRKIIGSNIFGTINLVNACSKVGFDIFINTGSSSEYGLKSKPMVETDLLEPISDYAVAKASATLFCQAKARREGLPIATLRLFSPYGYYEEPTRLIPSVIKSCLEGRNPKVSSSSYVRDFIFIKDVVNAYMKAIKTPHIGGQIFNIGYGLQHSLGDVLTKIIKLTRSKVKPEWGSSPKRPNEPSMWQADITKATNILNWKPRYSLEEGLKKTINWYENKRKD